MMRKEDEDIPNLPPNRSEDEDERKPAARVRKSGSVSEGKPPEADKSEGRPLAKKKRKSPAVPWKKPPDMPRRPLSAYNIFFQEQRKRLIGAGPESESIVPDEGAIESLSRDIGVESSDLEGGSPRRQETASGIGFANLAKTIAKMWKDLDPESRRPFDEKAAMEKKKYDIAVAEWRKRQPKPRSKKKPESKSQSIGEEIDHWPRADLDDPYPPEWFRAGDDRFSGRAADSMPSYGQFLHDDSMRSRSSRSLEAGMESPRQQIGEASHSSPPISPLPLHASSSHQLPNVSDILAGEGDLLDRRYMLYGRYGRSASLPVVPHHLNLDRDFLQIQNQIAQVKQSSSLLGRNIPVGQIPRSASLPMQAPPLRLGLDPLGAPSHLDTPPNERLDPLISSEYGLQMDIAAERNAGALQQRSADHNYAMSLQLQQQQQQHHHQHPLLMQSHRQQQERQQGGRPGEPAMATISEASLRALHESLDDETIDFLTSMRDL